MRALLLLLTPVALAHTYAVDGIVLAVDLVARTMLVSHRPIEHYMPAMAMPFRVADAATLVGLYPGARVAFELVVDSHRSLARNVRKSGPDAAIAAPKEQIHIGDRLPDFRLTDQSGAVVDAAALQGKVAAIDFIYTRCPLPDVCPRLAANFGALQQRFRARLGADLVLLSVTVDPEFDTPAVLAEYARRWTAGPAWHFLTGDIGALAAALGEVYWSDEGSIGHNSTTAIVGRDGRLAAMVEGSSYRGGSIGKFDRSRIGEGAMKAVTKAGLRTTLALALAAIGSAPFAAAQPKPVDNCVPPPSALAPTLPAKILPGMGIVHLAITTSNPETQRFFDQGLAQMHSFWAREAERSFLQAAALDPAAPMPHWGIAMVAAGDWRPRFQIDLLEQVAGKQAPPATSRARIAARRAVELAEVPGKASPLEKMYVASVAARRDQAARDPEDAFVKGLRALLAANPGEVEAQLELALMVMRGFSVQDHKPLGPGSTEAVAILRGLLPQNPEHPGLHHYIIHGFEGSELCQGRVAELRKVRATGAQYSACAAHAWAHLLADRALAGRRCIVLRRRGQRAHVDATGQAIRQRPSRAQRALPGDGLFVRGPL